MRDKARTYTDKELERTEKQISRVYEKHPALLSAKKEYMDYMRTVATSTKSLYEDYTNESDIELKKEKKKTYSDKVRELTIGSKKYLRVMRKFVSALTEANQSAIEIVNSKMVDIYTANYNQVAEDCEKVGIKVNGKK